MMFCASLLQYKIRRETYFLGPVYLKDETRTERYLLPYGNKQRAIGEISILGKAPEEKLRGINKYGVPLFLPVLPD